MIEPTSKAAFIISQSVCAMAEIAGMVSDNQLAAQLGERVVHGPYHFEKVIEKYGIGHNAVVGFLE